MIDRLAQMAHSTYPRLPAELLDLIVTFCSPSALKLCTLAGRTLWPAARYTLFSRIQLRDIDCVKFVALVKDIPDVLCLVEDLTLIFTVPFFLQNPLDPWPLAVMNETLRKDILSSLSFLSSGVLSHLRRLDLRGDDSERFDGLLHRSLVDLQPKAQDVLEKMCRMGGRLERVDLHWGGSLPLPILQSMRGVLKGVEADATFDIRSIGEVLRLDELESLKINLELWKRWDITQCVPFGLSRLQQLSLAATHSSLRAGDPSSLQHLLSICSDTLRCLSLKVVVYRYGLPIDLDLSHHELLRTFRLLLPRSSNLKLSQCPGLILSAIKVPPPNLEHLTVVLPSGIETDWEYMSEWNVLMDYVPTTVKKLRIVLDSNLCALIETKMLGAFRDRLAGLARSRQLLSVVIQPVDVRKWEEL